MKLKIAILLFLLLSIDSSSQENEWGTYDIDSIVSIDMPGEVYEVDSIINQHRIYEIFSQSDSITFYARRFYLDENFSGINPISTVKDLKSLKKFYQSFALVISEMKQQENSISTPIYFDKLMGYRLVFDNDTYFEHQMLLINKHLYAFQYLNHKGLDSIERKNFFDSIYINDEHDVFQFKKKASILNPTVVGITMVLILISFFARAKAKRKRRSFGERKNFH